MGKTNFVALELPETLINELHEVAQWIRTEFIDINFVPMERNSIHMTLCFLGNILIGKKKETIDEINKLIYNFPNDRHKNIVLSFDNFCLFPEIKQNLVVAKFKCHKSFIDDTIKFKKEFVKFGTTEENWFSPHVTLGKIQNKNNDTYIDLKKIPKIQETLIPISSVLI